ncbi:MAG: lipopolysaccharide kinase InaA family protein [Myxococcota bacterium]|nr:lipopolysaccharide kinase InaA family protein [Myxococcota bacterium]
MAATPDPLPERGGRADAADGSLVGAPAPGFERLDEGAVTLVIERSRRDAARALGLLRPGGLDALLDRHRGAEGRTHTGMLEVPGRDERWVARRLVHGGMLGPWLGERFLGLGRPLQELQVTRTLRAAGAPVPEPVGMVSERAGLFRRLAVLTVREEHTVDALEFLRAGPDRARVLRAAAAAGRAVRRFHDAGGRHADLHVKNLLVREQDGKAQVCVIDLDKARHTPGLTPDERMSQVMRLFRSLLKRGVLRTVGRRGCARFLGVYCGDDRPLRRAMMRRVDRELRMVAIHALRYPERGERALA